MGKKSYVIWKGDKTGVFDSWNEVKSYTQGRADAQFMGFESKAEAEAAFKSTYSKALAKRSLTKKPHQAKTAVYHPQQRKDANVDIQIYCDGACSPNPGKSGTGMAVYKQQQLIELWYGLYQKRGTNNTAELKGLLAAFNYAKTLIEQNKIDQGKKIQILSDSKYSIDCITKWAKSWQAKGWTRGKGEEIKNLDIIKPCFTLYLTLQNNVTISYVKGHANIEGNELSDRMAVLARAKQEVNFVKFTNITDINTILAMPSG